MRTVLPSLLLLSALLGPLPGCESAPASAPDPEPRAAEPEPLPGLDVFSGRRAFADLAALVEIGPRIAGSEGAARARDYLRGQLEALGLDVASIETPRRVEGREPVVLRHLSVTLPGDSPDLFVLVSPYDSSDLGEVAYLGANDGASGAALLLELTRVLSTRSLPYTTRIVFLDGEGRVEGADAQPAVEPWSGSAGLADVWNASGELRRVRLLAAFHRVGDADLRIARDLSSQRMFREEFFRAAERLSRTGAFPRNEGFASVEGSHTAFLERGVRGAGALADTRFGGDAVPGAWFETSEDTLERCAPESLEIVGQVTLEALDTIGRRLAKIDRFARSPLTPVEEPEPEPASEPAPEAEPES
ncbi:MAG: M28 family peptidase [Myxococcota bacterium]